MAMLLAGKILGQQRKIKKLTLKQVSNGICDSTTLSRIEKGQTTPSNYVFRSLMERLGVDSNKFFFMAMSEDDAEIQNEFDCIEGLVINGLLEEAEIRLQSLENKIKLEEQGDKGKINQSDMRIKHQTILRLWAAIFQLQKKNPAELNKIINEAISLTVPDFCEKDIGNYLLTYNEISLCNMLATSYSNVGDVEKTIDIFESVKTSMDRYYINEYEKSRGYTQTLFNLSNWLINIKQYYKAISVCETAIGFCIRNQRLIILPKLIFNKAYSLFCIGNKDEYPELMLQAYYTLLAYGDKDSAEIVKSYMNPQ